MAVISQSRQGCSFNHTDMIVSGARMAALSAPGSRPLDVQASGVETLAPSSQLKVSSTALCSGLLVMMLAHFVELRCAL
jgi:hypothetical protein